MKERIIELFDDQIEVLKRIDSLKAQGYDEDDMYIVVQDDEEIEMLKGSTGVMIAEEEESLFDRFKNFLSGSNSVTDAFNKMELEDEYRDTCYNEVKQGKILLMVNENYESKFELGPEGNIITPEEPEVAGTGLDGDGAVEESVENLPDDIKKDIGLDEFTKRPGSRDTLIEEQIAGDDIHRR